MSGKGAWKKGEKGKKDSPREADLPKKSNAGTSGAGRSAAATVTPAHAPTASSTPKPSALSGPSLKPKLTTATNGIGTDESVLPASGKAPAANTNMNLKKTVSTVIASSQFVSPATGLVVARVRHAAPGHVISVHERGQLARWSS